MTTHNCEYCGAPFERRKDSPKERRYCSPSCRWEKYKRLKAFGQSCPLRIVECDQCGKLFRSQRGRKRCSSDCYAQSNRVWHREYQRRTRFAAIRYWQFDKSDEAHDLAAQYFQLRQLLRRVHRGEQNQESR
jgi:hypothetical protein